MRLHSIAIGEALRRLVAKCLCAAVKAPGAGAGDASAGAGTRGAGTVGAGAGETLYVVGHTSDIGGTHWHISPN